MFSVNFDVVVSKIEKPTCPNVFSKDYYLDCETMDLPEQLGTLFAETKLYYNRSYNRDGDTNVKLVLNSIVEMKGNLYVPEDD